MGGERTESKCRKDKDHDLWYGPGHPTIQVEFPCAVYGTGAAASTGYTINAVGSSP